MARWVLDGSRRILFGEISRNGILGFHHASLLANWRQAILIAKCDQMQKSIHSQLSEVLRNHLVALRKEKGWTQREMATAVGREPSFIGRIELGERRVDVIEYFLLLQTLEVLPLEAVAELFRRFQDAADRMR